MSSNPVRVYSVVSRISHRTGHFIIWWCLKNLVFEAVLFLGLWPIGPSGLMCNNILLYWHILFDGSHTLSQEHSSDMCPECRISWSLYMSDSITQCYCGEAVWREFQYIGPAYTSYSLLHYGMAWNNHSCFKVIGHWMFRKPSFFSFWTTLRPSGGVHNSFQYTR